MPPPGAAAPLAPPLGELSAKLTERVSGAGYPLRRLIAASSPKGRARGAVSASVQIQFFDKLKIPNR